jgi:hypothetical protein
MTTVNALSLTGDGDKHTLIVNCPLPATDDAAGTGAGGRLHSLLSVTIEQTVAGAVEPTLLLSHANISACNTELVPVKVELGACTMFGEM